MRAAIRKHQVEWTLLRIFAVKNNRKIVQKIGQIIADKNYSVGEGGKTDYTRKRENNCKVIYLSRAQGLKFQFYVQVQGLPLARSQDSPFIITKER